MTRARDVRSITYLKTRAADLVCEVSEAGRTVTITQNGEAKVVVMDVDTYDRWRTVSQAEAFRRGSVVLKRAACAG